MRVDTSARSPTRAVARFAPRSPSVAVYPCRPASSRHRTDNYPRLQDSAISQHTASRRHPPGQTGYGEKPPASEPQPSLGDVFDLATSPGESRRGDLRSPVLEL